MKRLIYRSALLFCLGLIGNLPVSATTKVIEPVVQEEEKFRKEFTRNIKKEFDISADGTLSLLNKYGQVDVKTWDQNQVKIEIEIVVNASNEDNANETFDRINIDFSNSSNFVSAETTIESPKKSSWISSLWGGSYGGSSDFNINYEVHMPASCDLELNNKYGHSTVEAIKGKAKITAKYGDVRMDGVDNNLKLDIGYGNATVERTHNAEIYIKYGKLRVEEAHDVNLESKYSKIHIATAGDLETTSKYDNYRLGTIRDLNNQGKYDDFEIESVENINAIARYSDFDINKLTERGRFNLEYGELLIESVANRFSKIEIDSKYTDIEIEVDQDSGYELDVVTNYAGIRYPSKANVQHESDQGTTHEVKAMVGGQSNNGLIHIRSNYGSVKVR